MHLKQILTVFKLENNVEIKNALKTLNGMEVSVIITIKLAKKEVTVNEVNERRFEMLFL